MWIHLFHAGISHAFWVAGSSFHLLSVSLRGCGFFFPCSLENETDASVYYLFLISLKAVEIGFPLS